MQPGLWNFLKDERSVLVYRHLSVLSVKQMMCLFGKRLAEEFVICLDYGRILMTAAHCRLLVVSI